MVLGAYEQRIEKFTILYISIISFLFKLSNFVNLISCFLIEKGGNHMKGREKKLNFFYIYIFRLSEWYERKTQWWSHVVASKFWIFLYNLHTHSQEFNVWASKIWSPKKKIELLKWTKMNLKNIYIGQMNSLVA